MPKPTKDAGQSFYLQASESRGLSLFVSSSTRLSIATVLCGVVSQNWCHCSYYCSTSPYIQYHDRDRYYDRHRFCSSRSFPEALLDLGADPSAVDQAGYSPWMMVGEARPGLPRKVGV